MALVNRTFMLDITPGAIPQVVKVSEYDVNRAYTVTLIDEGGVYQIPSGTTATVEGSIGGNAFSETATVSGNTITFTLSESMTALAGDVWCKIKLVKDSKPIQTCAFILRCDRAGVEADTVIGAPGFEEQINQGVAAYFDGDPPFFELPEGGQSGEALLSDGNNGAYWGTVQSGGSGLSDEAKSALLACFQNTAWINDDGQTYYDVLYAALYPPADLVSIRAAFNQGSAVIYDTDSLDTLKQYLTVTAIMSDSTTRTVTGYTLSGTLTEGTSVITVSYGGKTTTFVVVVSAKLWDFDWDYTKGDPTTLGFSYEVVSNGTANYTSGVGVVLTSTNSGTASLKPNNVFAADKGIAEVLFSVQSFAPVYQGLVIIFANAMRFKVYNNKMDVNYTEQNTQAAAVNVATMSANTDYLLRVEWDRATGANISVNGANTLSINAPLTSIDFSRSILTQTAINGISVIKAWRMKEVS